VVIAYLLTTKSFLTIFSSQNALIAAQCVSPILVMVLFYLSRLTKHQKTAYDSPIP